MIGGTTAMIQAPGFKLRQLSLRIALCTGAAGIAALAPALPAMANPSGAAVVHGSATFMQDGGLLQIDNSPGAIINWTSFSIAQDEITRFQQQSAQSAVLNRVTGGEISEIFGQLVSNGHVFLINPNGMVFGQNATIDTAGFVASTLDITNQDFLDGNYRFAGDSGRIINEGYLTTRSGNVYFIAPDIENAGIIHAESGALVLAAGRSIRIGSLDAPDIQFEITAPDDAIINLGQLLADQGSIHAFAGTLTHSGAISASGAALAEDGSVILYAEGDIDLRAGSTISASGAAGGDILVQSGTGSVLSGGTVLAEGANGDGGRIRMLGERVGLLGQARVSAEGSGDGGEILIGGNVTGLGPEPNAKAVFIGTDTRVSASSTDSGDGGTIIAYAHDLNRSYGTLTARGGPNGGDGGFIETSAAFIEVTRTPDAGASNGAPGQWLIDPDLLVIDANGLVEVNEQDFDSLIIFSADPEAQAPTIQNTLIENAIDSGTSVWVQTAFETAGSIRIQAPLTFNATESGLVLNFFVDTGPDDNIFVEAPIINTGPASLEYGFIIGPGFVDFGADVDTGGSGDGLIIINSGQGATATFSSDVTLRGNLRTFLAGAEVDGFAVVIDGEASLGELTLQNGASLTVNGALIVIEGLGSGALVMSSANLVVAEETEIGVGFISGSSAVFGGDFSADELVVDDSDVDVFGFMDALVLDIRNQSRVTMTDSGFFETLTLTDSSLAVGLSLFADSIDVSNSQLDAGAVGVGVGVFDISGLSEVFITDLSVGALTISGGSFDIGGTAEVSDLTLSNGMLTGSGDVSVAGTFEWIGGRLAGTGLLDIVPGGSLTSTSFASLVMQDRTLRNRSDIGILIDRTVGLTLNGAAVLDNQGRMLVEQQNGTAGNFGGPGVILNSGSLEGGGFDIANRFDNSGVVSVTFANLRLLGGGTHSGSFLIGIDDSTTFAGLQFAGTHILDATSSIEGQSLFLPSGTATLNGTVNLDRLSTRFGHVIINSDADLNELTLAGSTAMLTGTGNISVANLFRWHEGTIGGSGTVTVAATAESQFGLFANPDPLRTLSGRTLTIADPDARLDLGRLQIVNGGVFENRGGFTFAFQDGTPFTIEGGADGTFRNLGSVTATSDLIFGTNTENSGSLQAPNLELAAGMTLNQNGGSVITPGTFDVRGTLTQQAGTLSAETIRFPTGSSATLAGSLAATAAEISGGSLAVGGSATFGDLDLNAGSLSGAGDALVAGTFAWTGGLLAGSGLLDIAPGGALVSSPGAALVMQDRTLRNRSDIGIDFLDVRLTLNGAAVLDNQGHMRIETLPGEFLQFSSGTGTILNSGTFEATGAVPEEPENATGGFISILNRFDNSGTVTLNSGFLNLHGGGMHSGSFQMVGTIGDSAAGRLGFGGTHTLGANSMVQGARLGVNFGTTTINGMIDLGSLFVSAGTAADPGRLIVNSDADLSLLSLIDGNPADDLAPMLAGTGNISVSTQFIWDGGTIGGTGTFTLADTVQFTQFGLAPSRPAGTAIPLLTLSGRTLISAVADARLERARLEIIDGGMFENSGVLTFGSEGGMPFTIEGGADGTFRNAGTVTASSDLIFGTNTENSGTLQAPNLALSAGRTLTHNGGSISTPGTFDVLGTLMQQAGTVSAGTIQFPAGSSATLGGTLTANAATINGGNLSVGGTANIADLGLSAGNLRGAGTIAVSTRLDWIGGAINGAGSLSLGADSTGTIGGAGRTLTGFTLNNAGTLELGSDLALAEGATLRNTGTIDVITPDGAGVTISGTAADTLDNQGSLVASTPLTLGVRTFTGGAFSAPALTLTAGTPMSIAGGSTSVAGTFAVAGDLMLLGGALAATTTNVTGSLGGIGTVTGNLTNSGVLSPGTSPGALTIDGNFTQTDLGTLILEVDGDASQPGVDFDLLTITGSASFDGTLELIALEGFGGSYGEDFQPITYASATGGFARIVQPSDGVQFTPVFGPNGLTAQQGLALNPDGTANIDPDNPPIPRDEAEAELIADAVARSRGTTQEQIETTNTTVTLSNEQQVVQDECAGQLDRPDATGDSTGQGVGCRSM